MRELSLSNLCSGAADLEAAEPLLLVAPGPASPSEPLARCALASLLRRDGPVLGVLGASLRGPSASVFLACDQILWLPRASLSLKPGALGETVLLSMRVSPAAAGRTWFGGGRLTRREAVRSGWAEACPGPLAHAVAEARRRVEGLSPAATRLLRPLLLREHSLARGPAEALERASFALLFDSGDPAEGARSFLEKRTPRFGKE